MTYNTGNPIGSADARDRADNSENMDILENSTILNAHPDRLGTMRKTRKGMELEHDNQIAAHEAEHDAQISAHELEHDNQMQSFENDFDGRLAGMAFTRVGTFTAGATLTDMRQTLLWEVSHGGDGHEYGWTGSFLPSGKVVAAGSTPATSGGIGAGAWVDRSDVTLRSELEEFESSVFIAGAKASELISVNPRRFGAHPITEVGYETFDSTQAFQDAIDYAIANNIGAVEFDGRYLIDTSLSTFDLPADDGTAYPGWVGAGDANLTPETVHQMPVCLKISSELILRAKNPETDCLTGSWNVASSPINISQKICLLITAGSKYEGTIKYGLMDFSISGFMIARVVEGTCEASAEQIAVVNCGLSGIIQGVERKNEGTMQYGNCISGDVHGGWWTQRNNTRQNNTYLPPYPSSDVFSMGWTDFCTTEYINYSQWKGAPFGARQEAIDSFFDTYFFKSANSATTSLGGRLTNNADPTTPAIMPAYYGVAGRARTVISRYGRAIANYRIKSLKTYGCHRTNVFYSPGAGAYVISCSIDSAYIEKCGLVDAHLDTTVGNLFGIDNTDAYRPANYGIGYSTCHGPGLGALTISSKCQNAPTHDGCGDTISGCLQVAKIKYDGTTESGRPYFLDFTTFGTTFTRHYRAHDRWLFTQPLRFGTEAGEDFAYTGLTTFSPSLVIGGVPQTTSTIEANYIKIGRVVNFRIVFFNNGAPVYPAGNVTVAGMPLPIGTTPRTYHQISIQQVNGLTPGIMVQGKMSPGTAVISLVKDSAGTELNGTDCNNSPVNTYWEISGQYWVF